MATELTEQSWAQTVAHFDQMRGQVDDALGNLNAQVYTGDQNVLVGPTREFTTLQAALDAITGRARQFVNVILDDGIYDIDDAVVANFGGTNGVTIKSASEDASGCILRKLHPAKTGAILDLAFFNQLHLQAVTLQTQADRVYSGSRALDFGNGLLRLTNVVFDGPFDVGGNIGSGSKIVISAGTGNGTGTGLDVRGARIGLSATEGATNVLSDDGAYRYTGGWREADQTATNEVTRYNETGAVVNTQESTAVIAESPSRVSLPEAEIAVCTRSADVRFGAYCNLQDAVIDDVNFALSARYNGTLRATRARITNFGESAILGAWGSNIIAVDCEFDRGDQSAGLAVDVRQGATADVSGTVFKNCDVGCRVASNGHVRAHNTIATAENVTTLHDHGASGTVNSDGGQMVYS